MGLGHWRNEKWEVVCLVEFAELGWAPNEAADDERHWGFAWFDDELLLSVDAAQSGHGSECEAVFVSGVVQLVNCLLCAVVDCDFALVAPFDRYRQQKFPKSTLKYKIDEWYLWVI